jgi:hypothetical protein
MPTHRPLCEKILTNNRTPRLGRHGRGYWR